MPFRALYEAARTRLELAFGLADAMEERVEDYWDARLPTGHSNAAVSYVAGQTQTVLTVVILGITIILGVLIYSEVYETVWPNADTDTANNTELQNAASNATTDYGDAMELAPVIMIVLIAAVVLGVVQRFRA